MPRRVSGRAAAFVIVAAYLAFLALRGFGPGFHFEKFEGFLGLGHSDQAGATMAFLQKFPIGTPLAPIKAYFDQIGGRCYVLADQPDKLHCVYDHMRYPPFPFLLTTWAANIEFDEHTQISTDVKITSGEEGL